MWSLLLVLAGCPSPDATYEPPPVELGPPVAGAAEGTLDLPVGTPLGGYSSRCGCLASTSGQDLRQSAYSEAFMESTGVQTRAQLKAVWLENGDDNLVLIKADVIYSYDDLVREITEQLEAATGEDLDGRVVLTASHTHSSYGPFSDQIHFYLGGDKFNAEIFHRFAAEAVEVALDAYGSREPVALGTSWVKDWDPEDRVYRDRREENDDLAVWPDMEPGYGKDPYLNMLRIDRLDGTPMAAVFTFGIHGILGSEENPLISADSVGHIEMATQELWDEPVVVMHMQGAGGDASPAGEDREFARAENLGETAAPLIYDAWANTPTSSDPIRMETASQHIWQYPTEIRVTRNGAVDWRYAELVPVEDADPDNLIYDENGEILPVFDEFNAPYGAAFCGNGDFDIPVGQIGAEVYPYTACMDVELMSALLKAFFDLETVPLPLPESLKAGTTTTRFGPIPTRMPDGTEEVRDVFGGFFPAEPTAMYSEQWRRRVRDELGHDMAWLVGYAQDHEGYFLIPEDWLMGGYEPNIAIWGPLQGEHVMEGMLAYGDLVLNTDVREDVDPWGWHRPTEYAEPVLPTDIIPDTAPDAGTLVTEAPEYFWIPEGFELALETPAEVERLHGQVQMAWIGGDPMVDLPRVALEVQAEDGSWREVTSHSGRPITDAFPDIITAHTPDPLWPVRDPQTHRWWAVWQAVGHDGYRAGLPAGTYRLTVHGKTYAGGAERWPWPTSDYTVSSDAFEVVPTEIAIEPVEGGAWLWFPPVADGYRMIDVDGRSQGDNPVRGDVTFTIDPPGGPSAQVVATPVEIANHRARFEVRIPAGSVVTVTDAAGNTGRYDPRPVDR